MKVVFLIIIILSLVCSYQALDLLRNVKSLSTRQPMSLHSFIVRGGKKNKKVKATKKAVVDNDEPIINIEDEVAPGFLGDETAEVDDEADDNDFSTNLNIIDKVPFVKSLLSQWKQTPPITQMFLSGSIFITLFSAIFNENKWPQVFNFDWIAILTRFQVWRIATAFLSFGPLDMFYPLNIKYVWDHMSQLEKLNCKQPEVFAVMLAFGAVTLIGTYTLMGISMSFLGHNLISYLIYIWSRVYEGTDVSYLGLITLKAEMLPWFFCLQTFIMEKGLPIADLIGIAVGHLYFYLNQKQALKPPISLNEWFSQPFIKKKYEAFRKNLE